MKIAQMSVELVDYMGSDLSVVNAARVSFDKTSDWEYFVESGVSTGEIYGLSEKDKKLISYLAKHNHFTPFCHAFLSFRIKAPLFVARQLGKHQVGLSWNEVSRRYVDSEPEFYFPEKWRAKADNVKQGSSDEIVNLSFDYSKQSALVSLAAYENLLKLKVCPEQARMILPQNMMTEFIWSGSLMAFARVVNLRKDSHTQLETQEMAGRIDVCIPKELEYSWRALVNVPG